MLDVSTHNRSISKATSQIVEVVPQLEDRLPYFGYYAGKSSLALFYCFLMGYKRETLYREKVH